MTAQEAAYQLLRELGEPASSQAIARMALERGLVRSNSKDPVNSIAQTIEKNIRVGAYNHPRLIFIHSNGHRLIGLPGTGPPQGVGKRPQADSTKVDLRVSIPGDLMEQIHLADRAGIGESLEETVTALVRSGLQSKKEEIRSRLMKKLEKLDTAVDAR